ncbi:phasin family protein [Marinobacterium weihaiense]|uniref:Phasin family protein n=1 Tax=Marinobacterium weihaiense TaxID=2851016 RepID=A0ABS6M7A4_9GAMM|nr:phasin family protein [Marinobacterium weihaiense]MBV0931789.1 phasin family protein [Marinobacterium weihaiense]
MYDKMKDSMKPVMDMAEINKKTTEKLIALQSGYVSEFVNASLNQMKTLAEVREPKAAVELQVKYLKEVESKLTDVAEKEMAALAEAKEQLTELVEKSVTDMGDVQNMPFMAELQKFMKPMDMTGKNAK